MAPVKIEKIICVSSEDEEHPACNLLKIDYSNKKWKCKTSGEKQISVVLQLAEFCKITSIDVGNEFSAFIEILVGKSCSANDDFKVLLVTSSLMTLQEAKFGTNINGVKFFKEDILCKPISDEKWDRIKIVCTQPFNRHTQYGLSFIVFHSNSKTLGDIQLKACTGTEPILKAGGLFANRNKLSKDTVATGAAAIRAAAGDVKVDFTLNSNNKDEERKVSKTPKNDEAKRKKKETTPKNLEITKKKQIKGVTSPIVSDKPPALDGPSSSKKKIVRPVQPFKKINKRPFSNLMSGVMFVISGFENPLRSELRNKAMAMGAHYEAKWNRSSSTHLICAFKNTPKYNEVRGHGKIVKKEWIERCYSQRARLPWRRFALDNNDAAQAESEDEVHELVDEHTQVNERNASNDSSDADTDEEIERVRRKQKKLNCINGVGASTSREDDDNNEGDAAESSPMDIDEDVGRDSSCNGRGDIDLYNMDTLSEEDDEVHRSKEKPSIDSSLPPLAPYFHGTTLVILDDLPQQDRRLLTRYIVAHQGCVANEKTDLNTILYVITGDTAAIDRVKEDYPQVIGVKPDWIWRSHDEAKLLPASDFTL